MAITTLSWAKTGVALKNRNLSTDPKRRAVGKVWNSMVRGARTIVRVTSAYESANLVNHESKSII